MQYINNESGYAPNTQIEPLQPVEAYASNDAASSFEPDAASERTAKDYSDAIAKILGLAGTVVAFVPGGGAAAGTAKGVAKVAAVAIPAARKAIPIAKKVVESNPELVNKAAVAAREMGSNAASAMRDMGSNAAAAAPAAFEKAGHAFGGSFARTRQALKGAAGKAAGVAGKAAGVAGTAAGAAAGAAGAVAHGAAAKVKGAVATREEEKARQEARRVVLEGAGVRLSAQKFLENWSQHAFVAQSAGAVAAPGQSAGAVAAPGQSAGAVAAPGQSAGVTAAPGQSAGAVATPGQLADASAPGQSAAAPSPGLDGYLAYPGCYVILTFDKGTKKDDFGKFREAYVGASSSMGAAIYADFIGLGNPDVYADVKYEQDVRVLVFPCAEENLDTLRTSLIVALDADTSYNRARA